MPLINPTPLSPETLVAQPATGASSWDAGQFGIVDNRFYQRGPLVCVAVRDNQGAKTNISPWVAGTPPTLNFTPFAADGNLRNDLFADKQISGNWFFNTTPNLGFFRIGAFGEKVGPDRKGSIKHDDQMILQSNFPFTTDLTAEGISIAFTGIEALKPVMIRLRMNMPLVDASGNNLVEDIGEPGYVLSKPVTAEVIDRQILCIFARKTSVGFIYSVEGYPLVRLTDIGASKRDKVDPDAAPLTFTALPDPFHTNLDPNVLPSVQSVVPQFYSQWVGGPGWASMYESGS